MKLLVDIGNHRLKWATSTQLDCRNPESAIDSQVLVFSESGFVPNLRACLETLDKPQGVWVASVAGDDVNQALTEVVHSAWGLDTVFLRAASRTRGIVNGYLEPGSLGVDRWAAIVAACERAPGEAVLIIDAGTAVTIDYVGTDRIFRGGVIVPGLHAMFNSLNLSTAQIRAYTGRETGCDLSLQNPDTRGAVENGVRLALASAVDNAIEQHTESASGDLRVFVAGGDAAWIQGNCHHHMEVAPELVLEGINFLAAETTDGGITP